MTESAEQRRSPRSAVVGALLLVLAMALGPGQSARAAVVTGVSNQSADFFDAPTYRTLNLDAARLVLPWDAGLRAGPWDDWLARAERDRADVLVALEHGAGSRCPGAPCTLPSQQEYAEALSALLAAHPTVREIAPWNEPNHNSQPTRHRPDAAAAYYETARDVCPGCVLVAGDFLDDGALPGYLAAYRAALSSSPAVWGLHNYYDTTYFETRGVDTMLRETSGALWLTETGGIVQFRPASGPGLGYDEQRASDGVAWMYALADRRPRIQRSYLYQWRGAPDNAFDSGLVGYDGTPRPAYGIVARRVGQRFGGALAEPTPRGAATGVPAAQDAGAVLRWAGKLRLLDGRRLEVSAGCVARSASRCRQLLLVRSAGRLLSRLHVDVASGRRFSRIVHVSRAAYRHLIAATRPRVRLQACRAKGDRCSAPQWQPVTRPLPATISSLRRDVSFCQPIGTTDV